MSLLYTYPLFLSLIGNCRGSAIVDAVTDDPPAVDCCIPAYDIVLDITRIDGRSKNYCPIRRGVPDYVVANVDRSVSESTINSDRGTGTEQTSIALD